MSAIDALVGAVLAAAKAATDAASAWEIGTVVAITPKAAADRFDAVTVDWNGTRLQVGRGSTYTPAVGDVVWMARKGPQLMIVDRYIAAPATLEGDSA